MAATQSHDQRPIRTFADAVAASDRVIPSLPGAASALREFGEFSYDGTGRQNDPFAYVRFQGRATHTQVLLSNAASGPQHLREVRVFADDRYLSLFSNMIEHEPRRNGRDFPSIQYRWAGGTPNPDEKGALIFLRVDLADDTFVNYYRGENGELRAAKEGQASLLEGYPEVLKPGDALAGQEVPYRIDYDAEAERILSASRLSAFLKAAEECSNGQQ